MAEQQRFALARSQRFNFVLLATIAVGLVVAGLATGNGIAVATGGVFALLAVFIGRQAFGPENAYLIDPDEFRHTRGDEVMLAVPWELVTNLRVMNTGARAGGIEQLAFDVAEVAQVLGAHRYRNTKKVTGHDIVVNLTPLGKRAGEATDAAHAAWSAATGRA